MTADRTTPQTDAAAEDISIFALGSAVLRRRRAVVVCAMIGAVVGVLTGLLSTRQYLSGAAFIPQGAESGGASSGLALAASTFGIRVPTSGGGWGTPVYVELLSSRSLLEPIALDTLTVAELGGKRVSVLDLFEIPKGTEAERLDRMVDALKEIVRANDVKPMNAVKFNVRTKWASVSKQIADRLVTGINQFNYKTRRSQAAAEREFVEAQAVAAEKTLRENEEKLKDFALHNRALMSADLVLERERLQREVAMATSVYTTLLQSREEARIREVRDTPVITVIETPKLPVSGEARHSAQKGLYGAAAGAVIAVLLALLIEALGLARQSSDPATQEFMGLLQGMTPRFLRGRASR